MEGAPDVVGVNVGLLFSPFIRGGREWSADGVLIR